MKNRLIIAIQKNGRLSEQSSTLLKKSGIKFRYKSRSLLAKSSNLPVDVLFVRDDDIPSLIANGDADIGIVGKNILFEQTKHKRNIKNILDLGFSKCRLSFAVPNNKAFKSLNNKRIATSYPNIVKAFLRKNKINSTVIKIHGSVELTPYIGISDCICDLVSTGATLKENNLIEFKTVLESEAILISNKNLKSNKSKILDLIYTRMKGVINARESKYVMLNTDVDTVKDICNLLPGADSPTIIPLEKSNKVAIHALCQEPVFWETMEQLKNKGASSILVMPVEKVLS